MRIQGLVFIFSMPLILHGQIKIEKEIDISKNEAPTLMQEFIAKQDFEKKIKWYKEFSEIGMTYEAKTCFKKFKYSIEFDSIGNLLDVEKTIPKRKLPKEVKASLDKQLHQEFLKYKLIKVQEQYKGDINAIDNIERAPNLEFHYEIVFKGKGKGKRQSKYYEILVDHNGNIIEQYEIVDRPIDNLEF